MPIHVIAKLYTWTAFPPLPPAIEPMDEFNQILNLLNGSSTNFTLSIKYSDATLPPLKLDQLNGADIFQAQLNGVTKASVNASGQLVSAVAGGTAPFSIASTTLCPNLNADLLDGLEATQQLRGDIISEDVKGDFQITKAASGTQSLIIAVDNDITTVKRSSDGATIFTITTMNGATRVMAWPSTLNTQLNFTPTASTDLVNKTYFDANKSTWIPIGGWTLNSTLNYIFYKWICPESSVYKITTLKGHIANNSFATGNSVITFYKNNSSIGSLTWTSAETGIKTNNIADINLAADDEVKAVLTTAGLHQRHTASAITEMQ